MQFRNEKWKEELREDVDDLRESDLGLVLHQLTMWNEKLDDRLRKIEGLFCLMCSGRGQLPCPSCGVDGNAGEGCGDCHRLGIVYCAGCGSSGRRIEPLTRASGLSKIEAQPAEDEAVPDPVAPITNRDDEDEFRIELTSLLNKHSMENGSNTPDFILANYLMACLKGFNLATKSRTKWYD